MRKYQVGQTFLSDDGKTTMRINHDNPRAKVYNVVFSNTETGITPDPYGRSIREDQIDRYWSLITNEDKAQEWDRVAALLQTEIDQLRKCNNCGDAVAVDVEQCELCIVAGHDCGWCNQ